MFENLNASPSAPPATPAAQRLKTGLLFPELAAVVPEEAEPVTDSRAGPAPAPGEPIPVAAAEPPELTDWKEMLRRDFEHWLADLKEFPPSEESELQSIDQPDLYSFYEQLAAANLENRKSNRRTAEAMSQWGETLVRFENTLGPLRETIANLAAVQPKADQLSRAHCLVLVEWLDRLQRIAKAFEAPPAKGAWWRGSDSAWRKVWAAQKQALAILMGHMEDLLRKEGVTRFETVGQRFDPVLMHAVVAEPDAARPPQTVIEELAAGYRRQGELLRAAQVKITRNP